MSAFGGVSASVGLDTIAEDVGRLFEDLAARRPGRRHVVSGECVPLVDVFETDRTVEIVVDVPGVSPDALRVAFKAGIVLIVGEKERPDPSTLARASFHVVERDFGRFVRAVRLNSAIDGAAARARLSNGELRVVLPRRHERRGLPLGIPIESVPQPSSE